MRGVGRHAVRRVGYAILGLGLLGMGSLGGGGRDPGMIARDFRATLTDADGVRIEVTRVNIGGDTTIEGDLGRGRLRVPFDNVASIRLEPVAQDRDKVRAQVTLRDGEPVTLLLRGSATLYGQTPSGAYQIRARDLRAVDFEQR